MNREGKALLESLYTKAPVAGRLWKYEEQKAGQWREGDARLGQRLAGPRSCRTVVGLLSLFLKQNFPNSGTVGKVIQCYLNNMECISQSLPFQFSVQASLT